MTRPQTTVCRALLAFVLAACALPSWGRAAEDAASGRAKPTAFLVLPVTSDEEGLGEHVQRMLRWKARRLGAVVYDPASVRDALAGQWQPVEKEMAWARNPDGPGKVLKFEMTPGTAAGYGLDYYSDWIRIEPGAVYRFSCRYKSLGPTVKIFLKGYHSFPAADGYPAQRREAYRRQVHPSGETDRWHEVVADFIPEATRPEHAPTFLKVDLFACYPAGVVYWDDVVLKKVCDTPVVPPPPAPAAAPPGKAEPAVEAPAESKDTP